jgi:hypothetical protein
MVMRLYGVHSLMFTVRDYFAPPGGLPLPSHLLGDQKVGFGDLFGGATAAETDQPVGWQELVDIVQRTVNNQSDPDVAAWSDEGGAAAIEYMNGVLIVTQTKRGHECVKELLDGLRERRATGSMVTVEARWVVLDAAKASELVDGRAAKSKLPVEVAEGALKKSGARIAYQAQVTCFNGQAVYVAAGRVEGYVADVEVQAVPNLTVANTTSGVVFCGAVLRVRPMLFTDRDCAVLDVYAEVGDLEEVRVKRLAIRGKAARDATLPEAHVEIPRIATHSLHTAITAPLGKSVLVGGMTDPQAKKGEMLYLVLKVSASK